MTALPFALNHMTTPSLPLGAFFELARSLGMSSVEIRNDLAGNAILDGTPAKDVAALAGRHDITIISINALQRFNEWNEVRQAEAVAAAEGAAPAAAPAAAGEAKGGEPAKAGGEKKK